MITTIDKRKSAINNYIRENDNERNQIMFQPSRVVIDESIELNTIPERIKAEASTQEQISGQNVMTSSINQMNNAGSDSTPSASSSN